ncbi:MAG: hypothetical protein H7641_06785 [Candidatus Heimdallarchaeota archaeon]|nr:hypothetical protein [Candidatus Heimdallarchaeota archaeon]MCK4877270.1 hypothetical protein [Candidatus Heimdallarchaeota archaeon]
MLIPTVFSESIPIKQINNHVASSCTIFTAAIGDTVYFGNNEDYKLNNAYRWYIPAQNVSTDYFGYKEIYGAVFFGFDNNNNTDVDGWEQGGMNEFGLCYDANGLPDVELNLNLISIYPYTPNALAQVLWDCRNVSEVIDWYQNHKWNGVLGGQFHYADSSGDAVVVSVNATGQWVFTGIDSTFLVSTNFNLHDTTHGYYPCNRYDTATQMLGEITTEEDLNVAKCAEVLYAVHQEGTYATKYSNICDPVNLEFYFNSGDEFSISEKFNLTAKLADMDSFEEKDRFFGVAGVDGGVLVKTEKIDIQFETNTNTTSETAGITLIISILGISVSVLVIDIFRKIIKKR